MKNINVLGDIYIPLYIVYIVIITVSHYDLISMQVMYENFIYRDDYFVISYYGINHYIMTQNRLLDLDTATVPHYSKINLVNKIPY